MFAPEQRSRWWLSHAVPQLTMELGSHITHLRQLADKVDRIHRDCTISNVTASSAGIASVILSVVGGLLAPFTGGLSTALTVTGVGLGAGAAATGTGTAIAESVIASAVEGEVRQLVSSGRNVLEKIREVLLFIERHTSFVQNSYESMNSITGCERAKALQGLTSQLSDINHQITQALARCVGSMTSGLHVLGRIASAVSLGLDVYRIVEGSMDLAAGARTELSERLRQQAWELEKLLPELNRLL